MRRHELSDEEWAIIAPLLPNNTRQRNLVERFFNRIKQMRGLATRYDRRADNYLAALKLAATRISIPLASESVS